MSAATLCSFNATSEDNANKIVITSTILTKLAQSAAKADEVHRLSPDSGSNRVTEVTRKICERDAAGWTKNRNLCPSRHMVKPEQLI